MRINSATIGMESERTYSATHARMSRLTRFSGKQSIMDGSGTLFGGFLQTDGENAEQSKDKKGVGNESLADIQGRMTNTRLNSQAISDTDDIREQMRQLRESCLRYLMQIFFPDKYKADSFETTEETGNTLQPGVTTLQPQLVTVNSVRLTNRYYYEESESTSFTTKGTVKTEDGREIDFHLNLNMSRSFMEYYEEEIDFEQLTLCDPLVINLEGNVAQVSDQTFFFDIDCDGVEDEISKLIAGSGFLALDQNGDGMISGDDGITFPLITLGAVGVISVIGNAFPREFSRMTRLALQGDFANALTIHHKFTELFSLLFVDGNPAGVKAMLNVMGLIENKLRLPLVPTRITTFEKMRAILDELKIKC